jgi:transposase
MQQLGIDISKDNFDVALILVESNPDKAKRKDFSNKDCGFSKLKSWLDVRATGPIHAAMEATGPYWEALAVFLCELGITVSVVNPGLVKKEAESWNIRNKTDKVDALTIARFCLAKRPRAWVPPPAEVRELRDLVRHLDSLEHEKRQNANRLCAGVKSATVERSLEDVIAFLDREIVRLKERIRDHINEHPGLKSNADLLKSIPGVGEKTAAVLLGELQHLSNFANAKQVSAFAGLSPRTVVSGKFRGQTRLCKAGNSRLRRALYLPAVVAAKCNYAVRDLYERLRSNGKCKMSAIGACMRKLLHIAYGVLKTGTPFRVPA